MKKFLILIILFSCLIFIILFDIQWWSLFSSTYLDFQSINQTQITSDKIKEEVYHQCKTISQRAYIPISNTHANKTYQNIYLFIQYIPRKDDEGDLYLQLATSYLLLQNLQQLSIEQQNHTYLIIFLHENFRTIMYKRLEQWFKSLFIPYISTIDIIPLKNNSQSLGKLMRNYIKRKNLIDLNTILFFLQDNYIYEKEMIFDTMEFFLTHEPCFIYQTDYFDRCGFDINDGFGHLIVPGKTRLWRSISSTTISYACRLKTFLAFEDIFINSKDDFDLNEKLRTQMDNNDIFFCAIPSYSTRIEKLLLPNEVNITNGEDMAAYYKDWWSMAREALTQARKKESFPCSKMDEQNLMHCNSSSLLF